MSDLSSLSISEALEGLKEKKYSARDLAQAALDAIKKRDGETHAYLEVYEDVLSQADRADEARAHGEKGALLGIPLAVKDNILIEGRVASAGSKILEGYVASYDATVIKKLKEAGAIFVGRANMDEFAMGGSTENSAYGPTKNPVDLSRVPGGSSGGSAAAVAEGGALGALGTDTGGSVRQPASFCGLVGLKPTYGSVSRSGIVALGTSLDQVGPLTKTVEDAELLFSVLKGNDPLDSTTLPNASYEKEHAVPKKLVVGVPRDFLGEGVDPEVQRVFDEAEERFRKLGCEIKDISLPHARYALAVYYIILPAEVSANLARYDGVRYGPRVEGNTVLEEYVKTRGRGFGSEPRRRIVLGTYVLSHGYYDAYYSKAMAVREKIRDDFRSAFKEVDILITPTAPTPAFKLGEKSKDPLTMYLEDIFTTPVSLAGVPAMSVPAGVAEVDGVSLPVGIQLIAPHTREDLLFYAGKLFERGAQ